MSNFNQESVLSVHHWTDTLFSFTTTRDPSFRFRNGEFTMIGAKGNENSNRGRADLLKTYKEGLSSLTPRPYIHNQVIELQGNGRASGRCYVELRDASNQMSWLGTGFYNDEYVKSGDEWKFKSRRVQLVHGEGRMAEGAPGRPALIHQRTGGGLVGSLRGKPGCRRRLAGGRGRGRDAPAAW